MKPNKNQEQLERLINSIELILNTCNSGMKSNEMLLQDIKKICKRELKHSLNPTK